MVSFLAFPSGILWTGATPQGDGTPVHISLPRIADPGGKKGGSLPSTSAFPVRHRRAARRSVTRTGTQVREMSPCTSKSPHCAHDPRCLMCTPRSARNPTFQRPESTSRKPARTPFREACREDDHGGSTEPTGCRLLPLASQITRTVVHEPPPPLEQVRAPVGRLDRVAHLVRQSRHRQRASSTMAHTPFSEPISKISRNSALIALR